MSKEIDLTKDPSELSEAELRYLQDRGQRPSGVPPIPVDAPVERPLDQVVNTGDVGLVGDQTEPVGPDGNADLEQVYEDNYDSEDVTIDDLKEELRNRKLKVSGKRHELVERLRQHDAASADDEDDGSDDGDDGSGDGSGDGNGGE